MEIKDLTIGQKIDAIIKWQTDGEMHPMTCTCKANLEIISFHIRKKELVILCDNCSVIQDWFPDVVFQKYIKEVLNGAS